MLVGPDAPLVIEPGLRGSYMSHVYDFYKPDLTSEYPEVDGQFSIRCYTEALDSCYKKYNAREQTLQSKAYTNGVHAEQEMPLDRFAYMVFHAPTCKLVSKSYARLLYNDYLADSDKPLFKDVPAQLKDIPQEHSLTDKNVEKTFLALAKNRFATRVQPSLEVPALCGNMYCASVYSSLVSLLCNISLDDDILGRRIGVFSYGSGLAASMFSLRLTGSIEDMRTQINLHKRLDKRRTVAPEVYDEMCNLREHAHLKKGYRPEGDIETIVRGTYYLTGVDEKFRRSYEVKQ